MPLRPEALRTLTPAHEHPADSSAFDIVSLASLPAILVLIAASGILIVLLLDVRSLLRKGRLTTVHIATSGALAALVVFLAVGFAGAVLQVPSASAHEVDDRPALEVFVPESVETGARDPLDGVQLPTLAE